MLPRQLRAPCKLLVAIPEGLRDHNYRIAVRQIYRKQEVGRVTCKLVPKNRLEE
jgi:serine protease